MRISFLVDYDEQRFRRVIKFLVHRQLRSVRVVGVVMVFLGAVLLVSGASSTLAGVLVTALGVVYVLLFEPYMVSKSMRVQPAITRERFVMTLDDDFTVQAHSYFCRYAWSVLTKVVDTPDGWYLMFSKI